MNDAILLIAVLLLGTSQVLQKLGATRRLQGTRTLRDWIAAMLSPELLGAVLAIVAGSALWLLVLYRMDVSRAFPFLSLGSVLVVPCRGSSCTSPCRRAAGSAWRSSRPASRWWPRHEPAQTRPLGPLLLGSSICCRPPDSSA